MAINLRYLAPRPDEELLSAVGAEATDEELREIMIYFVEHAPARKHLAGCPLRMLNTLSHAACVKLVAGLNRMTLISLFETERECCGAREENS